MTKKSTEPYVNYEYYQQQFGGQIVAETAFFNCAYRASLFIDHVTMGRARRLEEVPEVVKMACCALCEQIAQDEQNNGRVITAEKVGEYSVSYGDRTKLNQKMLQTVRMYLSQTNLLYRGSGC